MRQTLTHHDTLQLRDIVTIGDDLLLLPEKHSLPLHELDQLAIVNALPYAGFSYMVVNGHLCDQTEMAFRLFRLQHVRQLGFLQSPWCEKLLRQGIPLSDTTRWHHSLDVMAVATLIGTNFGKGAPWLSTLRASALSHDMATPAGGDSVKLIDPSQLDEDVNYAYVLDRHDWRRRLAPYGIRREGLIETIHNEGLSGEVLDIADKIAYVCRDLKATMHHIEMGAERYEPGLAMLESLVREHPYVGSVWDSVVECDGHAAFTDVSRLAAFLKVRLLLFRELYYHPRARFGEYFMSRFLAKALYRSKKLSRDELISMTDSDLLARIEAEYGSGDGSDPDLMWRICASNHTRCETFTALPEAEDFVRNLRARGVRFIELDDYRGVIRPGTHFRVKTGEGLRTLKEASPDTARELEEMAVVLPLVHVYYLKGDPGLPPGKLEKVYRDLGENP